MNKKLQNNWGFLAPILLAYKASIRRITISNASHLLNAMAKVITDDYLRAKCH